VNWKDSEGKRQRKFFPSKGEAKEWARQRELELLNGGREVLNFPSWLRVMAEQCQARLTPHGKDLRAATDHFIAALERSKASVPLSHAIAEFLARKAQRKVPLSKTYVWKLRTYLRRFLAGREEKLVEAITHEECQAFVDSLPFAPKTVNNALSILFEFFGWCMGRGRKWTPDNPMEGIEYHKIKEQAAGILSPEELRKLLEAADAEMLCYVAIGAFAGLRAAELRRLDWKEINLEDGFIEVLASKSKTATRRVIKIQPALRTWIEPFAKPSGRVCLNNSPALLIELWKKAGLTEWPNNALRHSFASYHLEMFKDAAALALEMGHTTTNLIFQFYRQLVRQSVALQYWNVLPGTGTDLPAMAARNSLRKCTLAKTKAILGNPKFKPNWYRRLYGYQKTTREYLALFGGCVASIENWMRRGMPLDDPEAMERLRHGEYTFNVRQHREMYGATSREVKTWRRAGWPLDDPERVRNYLEYVAETKRISGLVPAKATSSEATARVIQMPDQRAARFRSSQAV
jgi:integrase